MSVILLQFSAEVRNAQEYIDTPLPVNKTVKPEVVDPNFFERYNINDLSLYYPAPDKSDNKILIEVPIINQFPELPVGCEITSATAVLNYLGYDVDKVSMQEEFLSISYDFTTLEDGTRTGPDPSRVFVGDPKNTGFGCYAPVLINTLNKYFMSINSTNRALSIENANQESLELFLDNGIPLIVWASKDMLPYKYPDNNKWILNTTGEEFMWKANSHVLVLIGYDDENFYFSDCNNKKDYTMYPKKIFLSRWQQNNKQTVIINLKEKIK